MSATSRAQDAVIEHLANLTGNVRITPLPDSTAVLAQGWHGEPDTGHAVTPRYLLAADCDVEGECEALEHLAAFWRRMAAA